MCIGIPCQIVDRDGQWGTVDFGGNRRKVSLAVVPEAKQGDWVLVHAGLAIQVLEEEIAVETLSLLEALYEDKQ
jgi:hydrogenase expression/formation protein HypC